MKSIEIEPDYPENPEDHVSGGAASEAEECCGGHCGCHGTKTFVIDENSEVTEPTDEEVERPVEAALAQRSSEVAYDAPTEQRRKNTVQPVMPPLKNEDGTKLGRNDICLCGSGKKFKKCCMKVFG